MIIIKKGFYKEIPTRETCPKCNTIFEFYKRELDAILYFNFTEKLIHGKVICPVCDNSIDTIIKDE